MSFFSQFPKVDYDLLNNGVENEIIDIYRNVDVREFMIDDVITYTYYEVKDGERPDQVSKKLYGDDQYYWTFFITNDHLKDGLKAWPKSYRQLDNYIKTKYDKYSVITLEAKQKFSNGSFEGYIGDDGSINNIDGLDLFNDENIRIDLGSTGLFKPYLFDKNNFQLWFENTGVLIDNKESFKLEYEGEQTEKYNWLHTVFEPWMRKYNPRIVADIELTSTLGSAELEVLFDSLAFTVYDMSPIASLAPKNYINNDGDYISSYSVLVDKTEGNKDLYESYRQYEESKNDENGKLKIIRSNKIVAFADAYKELLNEG
jgi:hypothetical protein